MTDDKKQNAENEGTDIGSLLSPEATGGIVAGKGFDFQLRYAACHLPVWLQEGNFHQFFFEGTGDIDIRFVSDGKSFRRHIQVKDHDVTATEMKSVLQHFKSLDDKFPNVYARFVLACPGLAAKLRPVETGLARFRNAKPFYDDAPNALIPTKQELDQRIADCGLAEFTEFIHDKVDIEIGHGDLHHDDRAVEIFIARLLAHPEYAGKLRAMVQPAFAELIRAIGAKKGVVLERGSIEQILRNAIAVGTVSEKAIVLWIQNWTREQFDLTADHELDWSSHFDRPSRRVPSVEGWNSTLMPELSAMQKRIMAARTERLIRFRGKCALSTGVALGAMFPAVGSWVFEMPQPPSKEHWRSDTTPTQPYELKVEVVDGDTAATDIVLGLNIKGDGRAEIMRYIESTGSPPRVFAFMAPPSQGSQSIGGAADACAFSRAVRENLGLLIKKHQIRRTRIFFYGPFALSVFLGQQLSSIGEIQLFEYQDPGYIPSCTLRT
jgi:hypothetical protein